eukprot:TRINITY_DN11921_c0_g1_i1.p1 TRINITY_DN11921_c0_g1~~TRINITY_DN11921_c0_g1_i1.p1  ORF type:complete len:336 (+),score=48.22 TRINITY_DN11921_c0_g1_i1:593-1600(+)
MRKPLSMLDLLCTLAFLPDLIVDTDHYRGFVALRTLRLFQFLRLERQSKAFRSISIVLRSKKHELFSTFYVATVVMLIAAVVFWFIELDNPEVGSFGDALWWSVTALTTVGYGDVVPRTVQGKIFASVIALIGVAIFALPAGIIGSGFIELMVREANEHEHLCHPTPELLSTSRTPGSSGWGRSSMLSGLGSILHDVGQAHTHFSHKPDSECEFSPGSRVRANSRNSPLLAPREEMPSRFGTRPSSMSLESRMAVLEQKVDHRLGHIERMLGELCQHHRIAQRGEGKPPLPRQPSDVGHVEEDHSDTCPSVLPREGNYDLGGSHDEGFTLLEKPE